MQSFHVWVVFSSIVIAAEVETVVRRATSSMGSSGMDVDEDDSVSQEESDSSSAYIPTRVPPPPTSQGKDGKGLLSEKKSAPVGSSNWTEAILRIPQGGFTMELDDD
jgi:hypothetical protein